MSAILEIKKIEQACCCRARIFADWPTIDSIAAQMAHDTAHLSAPRPTEVNQWTSLWVADSTTRTYICKNKCCCENHPNTRRLFTAGRCTGRFTWVVSEYCEEALSDRCPRIHLDADGRFISSYIPEKDGDPVQDFIAAFLPDFSARVLDHTLCMEDNKIIFAGGAVIMPIVEPRNVLPFDPSIFDQTFVCKLCANELYDIFCVIRERGRFYTLCLPCADHLQAAGPLMRHPVSVAQRIEVCHAAGLLCDDLHAICMAAAVGVRVLTLDNRTVILLGDEFVAVSDPIWLLMTRANDARFHGRKILRLRWAASGLLSFA